MGPSCTSTRERLPNWNGFGDQKSISDWKFQPCFGYCHQRIHKHFQPFSFSLIFFIGGTIPRQLLIIPMREQISTDSFSCICAERTKNKRSELFGNSTEFWAICGYVFGILITKKKSFSSEMRRMHKVHGFVSKLKP